jgi:hypothetical protein
MTGWAMWEKWNSSSSMAQQPDVGPSPPESSPSIPLYPALLSSSFFFFLFGF